MQRHKYMSKGFTLVEILIVVVILGILAAVVIPQFGSATESARASSLKTQIQTINNQLQLYQANHNGNYPDVANKGWTQMTNKTDQNGTLDPAGTYGPYLQQPPINVFTQGSTIAVDATTGDWDYISTNNQVMAVLPVAEFTKASNGNLGSLSVTTDVVSK